MSESPSSFHALMAGLSAGEQQAARQIYERFVHRLIRLAARRLSRTLGPQADPESVAHSVFESFFERHAAGELVLHNWGMVFGLLSHITFKKCLSRNRDLTRQRRHPHAPGRPGEPGEVVRFADWQVAAAGPGPADEALIADLLATALAGFDADERAVIEAYMAGSTADAVAARVGLSTRTIQRVLERFRARLRDLTAAE